MVTADLDRHDRSLRLYPVIYRTLSGSMGQANRLDGVSQPISIPCDFPLEPPQHEGPEERYSCRSETVCPEQLILTFLEA